MVKLAFAETVVTMSKKEAKLIKSIESGEWRPVADGGVLREKIISAAKRTSLKDYRMNIRVSKQDVIVLKTLDIQHGMPYQTMVSSILYKYITC